MSEYKCVTKMLKKKEAEILYFDLQFHDQNFQSRSTILRNRFFVFR